MEIERITKKTPGKPINTLWVIDNTPSGKDVEAKLKKLTKEVFEYAQSTGNIRYQPDDETQTKAK